MIFMADLSAEVCFAAPQSQALMPITVTQGTSIRAAVMGSPLPSMFPDYDFSCLPCGVFGQVVDDEREVQVGDRIEVYRPLINDPKARRRNRAGR
jgi:putative ubiquitin-RnfH superfamily antitoxin RatB of RatAB toxin-antitoxin module